MLVDTAGTVSYTHLDVYKRQVNMEDKEATPVEDVETLLPPVEPKQPAPPEEQPEKPSQTENVAIQEMLRIMMEKMDENKEEFHKGRIG